MTPPPILTIPTLSSPPDGAGLARPGSVAYLLLSEADPRRLRAKGQVMKVFLSWSGSRSKFVSEILRWWLPRVIQSIRPWMSDEDISAGSRWLANVSNELSETHLGIICVTAENQNNPWLLFEAGSLSKVIDQSHVCPFLIDLTPSQLVGPLSQFQANQVNSEGTLKIVSTINQLLGPTKLSDADLTDAFEVWWPKFEERIRSTPDLTEITAKRSKDDMLEEVVSNTREQLRRENLRVEHDQRQADKFDNLIAKIESGLAFAQRLTEITQDLKFKPKRVIEAELAGLADITKALPGNMASMIDDLKKSMAANREHATDLLKDGEVE
jgi:hypothetical protein